MLRRRGGGYGRGYEAIKEAKGRMRRRWKRGRRTQTDVVIHRRRVCWGLWVEMSNKSAFILRQAMGSVCLLCID